MSKLKKFFKNIIVSFLIFYIIMANTSSSYARNFDDAARAFLAEQTQNFINQHAGDSVYSLTRAFFKGSTFYCCCTSGVAYMYQIFLGLNIYDLGYSDLSDTDMYSLKQPYWTEVSFAESKPGDILVRVGHVEMVAEAGNKSHFNFGSGRTNANLNVHPARDGEFSKVFSLNEDVQVTPTGSLPNVENELEEDNVTEDPADGFYYQGLATGSFAGQSQASLGKLINWLFNLISQFVDYVAGFITMLIKMVVIGWANVLVNIVTDAVDAITGEAVDTNATEQQNEDNTNENANNISLNTNNISINDNINTVTSNATAISTDNNGSTGEAQDILDSDALYTPSSTELQPEGDDKITIDKIIFNKVPLLDVNVFTDTAAGYTLKDDSSLKIVRDSVAEWYYIIRNVTIAVMLVILIYVGIKMAISSIASEKAEYKRLLVNWLVGFIIIFVIQYFLMLVLNINSQLLDWIINWQKSMGFEDSIYETVRTKAYEIKFSSGMVGTILYIILIILMLKFLYMYIKRFLAVCILIIMAPMMGASYAISKVRTGNAKSFTRWMKDYTLLVLIQSVHALVYTCLVTVALQLTNESIAGIVLALLVMHFMLQATDIITSIFGMTGDGRNGSRSLTTILNSDPKSEVLERFYIFKTVKDKLSGAASSIVQFGKDIKGKPAFFPKRVKQLAQAQGLGMGNLGKQALGQRWLGIKNIDTTTGLYIPPDPNKLETISALSTDLSREANLSRQQRKMDRDNLISGIFNKQNRNYDNAFKAATAIPLIGTASWSGIGAANLVDVSSQALGNAVHNKRNLKNSPKGKGKKFRFFAPVGNIMFMPVIATINNVRDVKQTAASGGNKLQTAYESRMSQINNAKTAERNIIDLYINGRRDREDDLKQVQVSDKDGKVIRAMAKTSFDDSYRRTVNNVFEVSDLVDNEIAMQDHDVQNYKSLHGISGTTLGEQSINNIKGQIREKARSNIEEKIRDKYSNGSNEPLDAETEQKIQDETEQRLKMFMRDLDKEIDDKADVYGYNPNYKVPAENAPDFSESIDADKLKSTIEGVMDAHNQKGGFEVSDLIDDSLRNEGAQQIQDYKVNFGIDRDTLGKESIDNIKEQIRNRATESIEEQIRDKYRRTPNEKLDDATEQRVKEETEEQVSSLMKDLDKELDGLVERDRFKNRAVDTTVIKDGKLDFSKSIDADTLKSSIEDVMRKHDADKKAEEGMKDLQEEMHRLQRIDRDYAHSDANTDGTYLYKSDTNISNASNNDKSNLKSVLSSLADRNIDIDRGRR